MDKKQDYENLKDFFIKVEAEAFVKVIKDLRALERITTDDGRTVMNEEYLNSPLYRDVVSLCKLLQNDRIEGLKVIEDVLTDRENKLSRANDSIDRLKVKIEKLKAEKQRQSVDIDELKTENDRLKAEIAEIQAANKELSFYVDMWKSRTAEREAEAEAYLTLAVDLEQEKEKKRQALVCNGKALELPPRIIKEVIRLWCQGHTIKEINADTGASRGQIERIVKGDLKHKESRKKVLRAINYLLKVNQNVVFIDKLKTLKDLYSK